MLLEFVLLELLEQYAAVKQQKRQAYECCSSRVLLDCRWALPLRLLLLLLLLLLLSARVPMIARPRRACVCLVFVALEQSSDRGVCFGCGAIGHAWKPTRHARVLQCYSSSTQQYNNSSNRRTSAARIECYSSAAECCCCRC